MAVCQNLVPLVNIKIAGKWMFIHLKMVLIGIDPTPNEFRDVGNSHLSAFAIMIGVRVTSIGAQHYTSRSCSWALGLSSETFISNTYPLVN